MMRPGREVDDRIGDWVDGRLTGKDRERFEAELRVNPQLRQDLEQYERTVAVLRRALQEPGPSVQLADRILAAIAAGQGTTAPGRSPWRLRPLVWSLATAAALLVVALLVDAWSGTGQPGKSLAVATRDGESPAVAPPGGSEPAGHDGVRPPTEDTALKGGVGMQRHRAGAGDGDRGEGAAEIAAPPRGARRAPPAPAGEDPRGEDAKAKEAVGVLATGLGAAPPVPSAAAPGPAEPGRLPLVVVQGRAPAAADLFRARAAREGAPATPDADASRRLDAFLVAQLAPANPVAERKAAAEPGWLQVAGLWLLPLPGPESAAKAKAEATAGGADAASEHDWLVEGSRQDVAALLARLGVFAAGVDLQLHSGETSAPSAPSAPAAAAAAAADRPRAPDAEPIRLVLRFRLQSR
ncbi:MAG: hypothetical protein KF830_01065 [Planctomycetes bacterium]|nr:hypothetical protein [Planctomycetota bacterium]